MSSDHLPLKKRALGTWIRGWQLAAKRSPPASRAIAHQIVMMLAHQLEELGQGHLSADEAFLLARETLSPLLAQCFFPGSEQDIAVERIQDAMAFAADEGR